MKEKLPDEFTPLRHDGIDHFLAIEDPRQVLALIPIGIGSLAHDK